jgi:hypothetical protein
LGAVLQAVKGNAAPERRDAFVRARQLWEQLRSPSEFLRIPYGQSFYHVFRGELDLALRFDEDLPRLSRHRYDFAGSFWVVCHERTVCVWFSAKMGPFFSLN